MAGMLRVSRSRGAFSRVLLVLLGVWGGLIPFLGPYVHYAYTPDRAWTYTSGRFWLEILPAVGAVLGGLIVLVSRLRPVALLGASLAALSGCWFAIGGALAPLWTAAAALPAQGTAVGGPAARAVEQIGFFTGLGAAIAVVASIALGRLSVVAARDLKTAAQPAPAGTTTPDTPGATPDTPRASGAREASDPQATSGARRASSARTASGARRASSARTVPGVWKAGPRKAPTDRAAVTADQATSAGKVPDFAQGDTSTTADRAPEGTGTAEPVGTSVGRHSRN